MTSRFWIALAAGLVALGLFSAAHAALTSAEMQVLTPAIRTVSANVLWAVLAVVPGVLAGYISGQRAVPLGVLLGLVSPLFIYAFSPLDWNAADYASHISALTGLALSAVVTNVVGAVAGAAAHPSNNSFKPKPLRGSA
jgi:hypothetical protein